MIICRVIGNVVSTTKTERLRGFKLLIVTNYNVLTKKDEGNNFVAVDTVGAGEKEIVMVVSGSSARQTEETEHRPVDATIVAIIDTIEIGEKIVFRK